MVIIKTQACAELKHLRKWQYHPLKTSGISFRSAPTASGRGKLLQTSLIDTTVLANQLRPDIITMAITSASLTSADQWEHSHDQCSEGKRNKSNSSRTGAPPVRPCSVPRAGRTQSQPSRVSFQFPCGVQMVSEGTSQKDASEKLSSCPQLTHWSSSYSLEKSSFSLSCLSLSMSLGNMEG